MKIKRKNDMKYVKNLTKVNGITLIALVVTIIVLLILAGISIAMLTGKNGIQSRAGEARYTNSVAEFEEKVKLAEFSLQASITNKSRVNPGYIATEANNFKKLAGEVANDVGLKEDDAIKGENNTTEINTEGYTVGYYLDTEGNDTTEGEGYIVIWYTNNSLRSSMNRDEAITKYGINDVATNKSVNQAVLVAVIGVENYNCKLSEKGLTSTTDGNDDVTKNAFSKTSLNGMLDFTSTGSGTTDSQTEIGLNEYVKDGLILWYDGIQNTRAGNNSNAITWEDLSGNNNDGIFSNAMVANQNDITSTSKGYYDVNEQGYVFWHNDAYIQSINNIGISGDDNFTVEIVYKPYNAGSNPNYSPVGVGLPLWFGKDAWDVGASFQLGLQRNEKKIFCWYINEGAYSPASVDDLLNSTNAYSFRKNKQGVISSGDTDYIKIFLNGTATNSTTTFNNVTAHIEESPIYIGRSWQFWDHNRTGYCCIYSIRIYNRVLTDEEVYKNYRADKQRFNINKFLSKVPTLTNNEDTNVGNLLYTNFLNNNESPYKAFDGDKSTFQSFAGNTIVQDAYIGYKFNNPEKIDYVLYTPGWYNAVDDDYISFVIQGSNDGTNYTNLSNEIIINSSKKGTYTGDTEKIELNSAEKFSYIRIKFVEAKRNYIHVYNNYSYRVNEIKFCEKE